MAIDGLKAVWLNHWVEDAIDQLYFEKLANDAKDHISEFMNYDEFMTIDAPADKLMEAA